MARFAIVSALWTSPVSSQPGIAPSFEVASIKPAPPQLGNRLSIRMSVDAGRLTYTNVSLRDIVKQAYRVQEGQVSGPEWLATERFHIAAKIPQGVPQDQAPQMLQALLAERFQLRLHREKKDARLYTLGVAKGGPKLPKAESSTGTTRGTSRAWSHLSAHLTMAQFADYLAQQVGLLVVDRTGLDGVFAIALEWAPDTVDPADSGPSLFAALQEQLGLLLTAQRGPVEILVIDYAARVPTEN